MFNILIALCLFISSSVAHAQFSFTTNANNTITITAYGGLGRNAIIPAMTNGYPVTTIAPGAFLSSSMTNVFIPYTLTNAGINPFENNLELATINIDAQNPLWSSVDGVWFDKDQTTLIRFPEAKSGYTIPDSVTNIGSYAFGLCNNLTNIIIPNSVSCTGSNIFQGCNITNLVLRRL